MGSARCSSNSLAERDMDPGAKARHIAFEPLRVPAHGDQKLKVKLNKKESQRQARDPRHVSSPSHVSTVPGRLADCVYPKTDGRVRARVATQRARKALGLRR